MEHYRRTAHTRLDIKFHPVWITSTPLANNPLPSFPMGKSRLMRGKWW
jgi:hypothetical protein